MRKTKIIATMGPSLNEVNDIIESYKMGVTMFRLNIGLRHRDHLNYFKKIRIAENEINEKLDVMIDFPTMRPRFYSNVDKVINIGDIIYLTKTINYQNDIALYGIDKYIFNINVGNTVLYRDGKICFKVLDVDYKNYIIKLECTKVTDILKMGGACTFPELNLEYDTISKEDISIIKKFNNEGLIPDFILLSFAGKAAQIKEIKKFSNKMWEKESDKIKIVSKIENQRGIENFDEILNESDGIMIGRGDLALNINPITLPKTQRKIMHKMNNLDKLGIIATGFLEDYSNDGVIRKSELIDISTAILQGADALMLSSESGNSPRALKCIKLMNDVIEEELRD